MSQVTATTPTPGRSEPAAKRKGLHVLFEDLPPDTKDRLLEIYAAGGLGEFSLFLRRGYRRWVYLLGFPCFALGATLSVRSVAHLEAGAHPAWWQIGLLAVMVLLPLGFGCATVVDWLRSWGSPFKPFFFLTPSTIVQADLAHHPLHIYCVQDATDFKATDHYSHSSWTGRVYTFTFGDEIVSVTLKDRDAIQTMENVLELARARGRGEARPECPATTSGNLYPRGEVIRHEVGILGQLINPVSGFWITTGALALAVLLLAFITGAVLGKF